MQTPLIKKHTWRYVLCIMCIVFTLAGKIVAQPYATVNTFSISQGLTTNHITHIAQDDTGLMWFSSINGLWSFDGYQFTPYHDYGTFESITAQRYLSARITHTGKIYLTDSNRRLYIYDCHTNKFYSLAQIMKAKGINMRVRDIMPLENGHTWLIGMRNEAPGLVRIDDNLVLQGKGIEVISKTPLTAATYRAFICPDGTELIYGLIGVYAPGRGQIYKRGIKTMAKRNNAIYFGGVGGTIAVYDLKKKSFSHFQMPEGVNEVTNMVDLDKRRIACGTDKGVAVIDLLSHRVSLINIQHPASPSNHITNLFVDSRHRLWVFSDSDGLTVIQPNLKDKQWITARAAEPTLQTTSKSTIWLQDLNGTVWTIPRNGTFSFYDETSGELVPCPIYEQDNRQYTIPAMEKTFIDRQKNLWFTGLHSFNMLSFGEYKFKKTKTELFGNVRALLIDKKGNLWTGNEKGSLMVYDRAGKFIGYVDRNGKISQTPQSFSGAIYSLFEDSNGRKWIGTKEDGLYVIDNAGKVTNYRNSTSDKYSLSANRVNAILQDPRGHIWIGTYGGGLNLVDEQDKGMRFINSNSHLGKNPLDNDYNIRDITQCKDGTIIISTTHGLVCFNCAFKSPADITFHYLRTHDDTSEAETFYDVIQTLVTKSGRIFMATVNGEINEIDASSLLGNPKTKSVLKESVNEGPINGLFEDDGGNLWAVRENNLDRYNVRTGKTTTFWPGKVSNFCDFTEARPVMNHMNGKAIIASQDGYITFAPKSVTIHSDIPKIIFTSILLNGDKNTTPVLYKKEIELPSDKHSFTINFAALDYTGGKYIRYAYKLEGVDKQWNNIGYDHRVSFNDLSSGKYRLLVKSTNTEGQWLENTATLIIHATPAWWETWWAKAIYLLVAVGIVCLLCKYYLIRRRINIDKIISERKTMLYREASHKLRTPLTLIGGPIVEVLKSSNLSQQEREYLETARANSRSMLNLVDTMLSDNMEGSYFVDDKNAPVFAKEKAAEDTESLASSDIRILVVEDNKDLRRFLVSLLSPTYTVITAENGKEGFEKTVAEMPDFILSDVTMPVMDGLTMVSLIKKNPDICHIPIIILSARASVEDKAQGISQGIDDYITKPFSAQYLKQRMAEVIANRRSEQQQSYNEMSREGKDSGYRLSNAKIVDADRKTMALLMEYLEENISNADMRVDDMAAAVNLGRTVFFNKIKGIVGMSPTDFVRDLRIKRATELIKKSQMTISEISIAVGFNDQRYFSRVFKKQTGMTPSEYRDNNLESQKD